MNDYNLSFSTYSEVENDFERRVVEFEEKVSRDFIEHYKIIKSQNSKMIKDENLDTVINFSTELIGYLKTISGYKDFDKCDAATQKNIANNFSNHDDFGKPIGYVNSGGLFSNGKTGILFFENGLSVRSKMEKNEMSISYSNLCCGIVRKNNKYILAANKFSVSPILLNDNNKMFIIEPAEKMYSKMIVIRNILLSENDVVKSIYEICYQNILKMILDAFSKKAFQDAIDWCKILNEFAISNSNNNYVAPIELEILLNILNHNFITDNNYTPEWVEYTQNKNKEFRHIESIKYYYNAFIAINENEIENAISYIKKSIKYFSSAQSWELYVKIISEKAKKENLFMYNYTLELLSREEELMNAKDISESTINTFNKIKIDYSIFQKNLRNEIITRIKSNDIDFFKDNISLVKNYIDDLGMSPLHYAALLKNSTVLSIIYDSTANKNNIDLFKSEFLDLAYLSSSDLDEYRETYFIYDFWLKDKTEEYNKILRSLNMQKLKIDAAAVICETSAENTLRKVSRESEKNHHYDLEAADKACETLDNIDNARDLLDKAFSKVNSDFIMSLNDYYNPKKAHLINEVITSLDFDTSNLIEIKPEDYNHYNDYTDFIAILEKAKEDFIKKSMANLTDKGEFETTEQFEIRKNSFKSVSLNEFEKLIPSIFELYRKEINNDNQIKTQKKQLALLYIDMFYSKSAKLEKYNADEGYFTISTQGLKSIIKTELPVSLNNAPLFKEAFDRTGVPLKLTNLAYINNQISVEYILRHLESEYTITFIEELK